MLRLDNFSLGDTDTIFLKFDTGAINTVIGIRVLFEYLSKNDFNKLLEALKESGIEAESFRRGSKVLELNEIVKSINSTLAH